MKSDIDGCSTCPMGQESYEEYYSPLARGMRVQYDYRHINGKLFGCVARSLAEARRQRDEWLANQH